MRKILTILLLILFLFNVGGYYIVFWGLKQHADIALTARLDANLYSDEELVELKLPMSLPYPVENQEFERVNGKFEHNGEFYKLVKQKFHNDTLYVVCIKDHEEKKLVKTMNDYVKMSNDLPNAKNKALNLLGKLLKEYSVEPSVKLSDVFPIEIRVSFSDFHHNPATHFASIPSPPPRLL